MPATHESTQRFRRTFDSALEAPRWPDSVGVRALLPRDAQAVYDLLSANYPDDSGIGGSFETLWQKLSNDPEFDPALCFLAVDRRDRLLGVAQCWTSAFIKDLAVLTEARGRGIGEALLWHVFAVFRSRGAQHVDLKVIAENATARRLYHRVGMRRVPLTG